MLVVSVTQEGMDRLEAVQELADAIEIRADTFSPWPLWKELIRKIPKPVILTLRTRKEGGFFAGNYEAALRQLIESGAAFLDVEWHVASQFIAKLASDYPAQKFICSYHDWEGTDFDKIQKHAKAFKAELYKIATMAKTPMDAFDMLDYTLRHPSVAGMCMGPYGELTRILAPLVGSPLTMASIDAETHTAPGQLSIHELIHLYRFRKLNPTSRIFALLGHPVMQSYSHVTHNRIFDALNYNAVYVKIDLLPEALTPFWKRVQHLPFDGFSITIPHKRDILKYCDALTPRAQEIGAVNTLYKRGGQWWGDNTDAPGAIQAIESKRPLKGQRVVILGTGGVAHALAYECKAKGASVTVVGRTLAKAQAAMQDTHADAALSYATFHGPYDVFINATSVGMVPDIHATPLDNQHIPSTALVFDVVHAPAETKFLQEAIRKGADTVSGVEMFINQAILQFEHWCPGLASKHQIKQWLRDFL